MPSFVNLGAYVDEGTMVDTWATVGSCAQIGKNCHISGGAGIGGVLEPLQAGPVIIEDNCFVGARSEVAEGVRRRRRLGARRWASSSAPRPRSSTAPPARSIRARCRPIRWSSPARCPASRCRTASPARLSIARSSSSGRREDPLQDLDQRAAARLTVAVRLSGADGVIEYIGVLIAAASWRRIPGLVPGKAGDGAATRMRRPHSGHHFTMTGSAHQSSGNTWSGNELGPFSRLRLIDHRGQYWVSSSSGSSSSSHGSPCSRSSVAAARLLRDNIGASISALGMGLLVLVIVTIPMLISGSLGDRGCTTATGSGGGCSCSAPSVLGGIGASLVDAWPRAQRRKLRDRDLEPWWSFDSCAARSVPTSDWPDPLDAGTRATPERVDLSADPIAIARDLLRCPSVTPAEGGALA